MTDTLRLAFDVSAFTAQLAQLAQLRAYAADPRQERLPLHVIDYPCLPHD